MLRFFFSLGLVLIFSSGPFLHAYAEPSGYEKRSVTVKGEERFYYVRSIFKNPDSAIKHPLLIALHGAGSNPEQLMAASGLSAKAEKENFIIVYPLGTGAVENRLSWNAGNCCSDAHENKAQDEDFIAALVDQLITTLPVDQKRIYMAGFSNGGMLAYRAAARLADKIAAVGVVSGAMFADQPKPSAPLSVIFFHGTNDKVVPYEGGLSKRSILKTEVDTPFMAATDIQKFWLTENICTAAPEEMKKGNILTLAHHKCSHNVSVVFNTIKNSAHNWPGASQGVYSEYDDGSYYLGFSATDAMWSFFSKHPKE